VWHGAAAENGLEVDPLALDRVELCEGAVEQRELGGVLLDGVSEAAEEGRLLLGVSVRVRVRARVRARARVRVRVRVRVRAGVGAP